MNSVQKYPTRRLECWEKGEELRKQHRHYVWEAQKHGELLIHGMSYFHGVMAGMGNFSHTEMTPSFGVLMKDQRSAIKCLEAAETRGFNQDVCSSMRCHLGAAFMGFGLTNREGKTVKPDFVFQAVQCHSLGKTSQIFSEYWGLPYFAVDVPWIDNPTTRQYLVNQLHEFIEWMEKTTNRKYDDELLLRGARNEWRCMALWAEVLELNQAVPAPLELRQLLLLEIPSQLLRHRDETIAFYEEMLEEIKERVKDGISAKGYETCRLMHAGFPPMYKLDILSYPAEFGAIYIACDLAWEHAGWSTLKLNESDWKPLPLMPEEAGLPLRNRDDALKMLAELYIAHRPQTCPWDNASERFIKMVQGWKIGGSIIHIDRGCKGIQAGILETKLAMDQKGMPAMIYESSSYDPREFSEVQIKDRMDSFMERIGLNRLDRVKV